MLLRLMILIPLIGLHAQIFSSEGDAALAEKYVQWAEDALAAGRWSEARIVLERGADYANVSSDLSYLLAIARSRFGSPRGSVLAALRSALNLDSWNHYTPGEARLLEAENLIAVKAWENALDTLALTGETPRSAALRLVALRFAPRTEEFVRYTREVLDRFPRETEPAAIFLNYLLTKMPDGILSPGEQQILDLILRRLPILLPHDEDLAWMAAFFMRDTLEAARLVSAYRAVHEPVIESLPAALHLGIVNEMTAVDEFFSSGNRSRGIDRSLLETFWELLGTPEARDSLGKNLSLYTGFITGDENGDGIPEARAEYANSQLQNYHYDEDQDGLPELAIQFAAGNPEYGFAAVPPESGALPAVISRENQRQRIALRWERYPAVLEVEWNGERFIPRPLSLHFAPVHFLELSAPELSNGRYEEGFAVNGLLFPVRDPMAPALTRRNLIACSLKVERPGVEFSGALEVVELNMSIPVSAKEFLDGRLVSETEFLRGRPQLQRVDMDLNGSFETVRFFRNFSLMRDGGLPPAEELLDYERIYEYAESDWRGDGILEVFQEESD